MCSSERGNVDSWSMKSQDEVGQKRMDAQSKWTHWPEKIETWIAHIAQPAGPYVDSARCNDGRKAGAKLVKGRPHAGVPLIFWEWSSRRSLQGHEFSDSASSCRSDTPRERPLEPRCCELSCASLNSDRSSTSSTLTPCISRIFSAFSIAEIVLGLAMGHNAVLIKAARASFKDTVWRGSSFPRTKRFATTWKSLHTASKETVSVEIERNDRSAFDAIGVLTRNPQHFEQLVVTSGTQTVRAVQLWNLFHRHKFIAVDQSDSGPKRVFTPRTGSQWKMTASKEWTTSFFSVWRTC